MRTVIYLDEGYFKLADIDEWIGLMRKYNNRKLRGKILDIDLSLFNALQHSISRQSQSFLRELYDAN
jgi:hypothetical protein